jgi:hypothetical protein
MQHIKKSSVIYRNCKNQVMKKTIIQKAGLMMFVFGTYVLLSCSTSVLTGQTVKESRDLPSFSGVSLSFSGNVYIAQGAQQKVEIEAEKSILDIIETRMDDNTLELKTKDGRWRDLGEIKVYITVPEITSLSIAGSGDILCETPVNSHEMDLNVSGSGSIRMNNLTAHEVDVVITGSGNIYLQGKTIDSGEMDATITGSGNFKAEAFPVGEANINITGSGSAAINVLNELETNITGSGSVNYKGNPQVNARATGSGRTRSMN